MKKLIYLASPYSHTDPEVVETRFEAALRHASELSMRGKPVFSPIVHTHLMVKVYGLPGDWQTWWPINKEYMLNCGLMLVLKLDGWEQSDGVVKEINFAQSIDLPYRHREDKGHGKVIFPEMVVPRAMNEVREVLCHGDIKWPGNKWKKQSRKEHADRLIRHLKAGIGATPNEQESERHNLAHMVCRGLFLLEKDLC